jgi:hypothetical protein
VAVRPNADFEKNHKGKGKDKGKSKKKVTRVLALRGKDTLTWYRFDHHPGTKGVFLLNLRSSCQC